MASTSSARCTTPARHAFAAVHGIGPSRFQSTFTVASSHTNRRRSSTTRGRRCCAPTSPSKRRGASTSARTAFVTRISSLRARTAIARTTIDDDAVDRRIALDARTLAAESGDERLGEPPRATLGYRPTHVLRERVQHESEDAAQRFVGREIDVQPRTCEQPARAHGTELLFADPARRQQRETGEAQRTVGT